MDYKGIKCPVCDKPFTESDDIVVCPKCGAPYHRECYAEQGECIFTELHESGAAWIPPRAPGAPDISSEIKDKECPNCGVLNAHSAMFCNICGASLTGEPHQHKNSAYNNNNNAQQNGFNGAYRPHVNASFSGFGGMPFIVDPMGGVNPTEKLEDNVSYGEVSKVVQQNTSYYMSVFRVIKKFRRTKFNFSAFLFSGGWLLYRKQYKSGIITTVLMFLLNIAQTLLSNFGTLSVMTSALDKAGVVNDADLNYAQISNITSEYLLDNPDKALLFFSPLICTAIMFAIMLIVGFCGNKWYMKHCIKTVKSIKAENAPSQEMLDSAYAARGGVNVAVIFCLMACYMVLQWIPMFFA